MKVAKILWRKLHSFLKLTLVEQLLVPIIWMMLGAARLTILTLPFRYFSNSLGHSTKNPSFTPILSAEEIERASQLGQIVRATAKITPWDSLCLPQALVASILLRVAGIPYIMNFGLAKNNNPDEIKPMKAHAWVTAGKVAVTGGRNNLFKYKVVGTFLSPLLV